jgi:pyruvate/2-oxoglutarate/acetoin dehydrogenase E1 component/TPP-dependent pyruvate/acetoin dehydrogenase alpha subunit
MSNRAPSQRDGSLQLELYRTMATILAADQAVQVALSTGDVAFQYYGCNGQEAIPAGFGAALRDDDYLVTTYRGLHDLIGKKIPLELIMAELYGRKTGLSKGKGGAMHLSYPPRGLMVTSGIVGGALPIATGLGLASQLKKEDRITLACFGDGATSIGAFHEAMGFAALWQLPIVFMCQNNQYAEYTALTDYTRMPELWRRGEAYGIPGVRVDGTDPLAVYEATTAAVERARRGGGPTFIEALCLRLTGHSFGSDESHMDQQALASGRAAPPVVRFRNRLLEQNIASRADLDKLQRDVEAQVQGSIEYARAQPMPDKADLYTDIFANPADVPGSPFERETLAVTEPARAGDRKKTFVQAVNEAFAIAMQADERVVLMGEDIADPTGGVVKSTAGLSTRFGKHRVRATPIAEQAIVGAGIGAALAGLRPVCEVMIVDFVGVCMDQIANHAAKLRYMSGGTTSVPMTIVTVMANGLSGFGAQHAQALEAWLTHVPGLKVVMPCTAFDAKGLLLSAIFDEDPVVFIEPARLLWSADHVPEEDYRIPIGAARIARAGKDATIITYGWTVAESLAAAETLASKGIEVEVIDLRTLAPIDWSTVSRSVTKTGRAIVVHSAVGFCGLGAELAATLHATLPAALKAPVARVTSAFTPMPYSSTLDAGHYPTREQIVAAVNGTL